MLKYLVQGNKFAAPVAVVALECMTLLYLTWIIWNSRNPTMQRSGWLTTIFLIRVIAVEEVVVSYMLLCFFTVVAVVLLLVVIGGGGGGDVCGGDGVGSGGAICSADKYMANKLLATRVTPGWPWASF